MLGRNFAEDVFSVEVCLQHAGKWSVAFASLRYKVVDVIEHLVWCRACSVTLLHNQPATGLSRRLGSVLMTRSMHQPTMRMHTPFISIRVVSCYPCREPRGPRSSEHCWRLSGILGLDLWRRAANHPARNDVSFAGGQTRPCHVSSCGYSVLFMPGDRAVGCHATVYLWCVQQQHLLHTHAWLSILSSRSAWQMACRSRLQTQMLCAFMGEQDAMCQSSTRQNLVLDWISMEGTRSRARFDDVVGQTTCAKQRTCVRHGFGAQKAWIRHGPA